VAGEVSNSVKPSTETGRRRGWREI